MLSCNYRQNYPTTYTGARLWNVFSSFLNEDYAGMSAQEQMRHFHCEFLQILVMKFLPCLGKD